MNYYLMLVCVHLFPKSSNQNTYPLVIVYYCSKWVELSLLRSAKSSTIAGVFIQDIPSTDRSNRACKPESKIHDRCVCEDDDVPRGGSGMDPGSPTVSG